MELWRTGLVLVLAGTLCDSFWVPGTEVVYNYYARLDANSVEPEESMSRWAMKGKLVVQVSGETAMVQYDSVMKDSPPPEDIGHLLQPFILHFENGKVVNLAVKAGEDMWAINMKRGLADVISLRHYKLEPTGPNGELVISSVVADGGVYYHPFQAQTEGLGLWHFLQISKSISNKNFYFPIRMELHQETLGTIKESISVKGGGEKVGLRYEMPSADVSQGRSPPSQKQLISAVKKMLQELGESLEPPALETNLTKLHEERVAHILNIFMEVLRLVGSHDAVLLIRDLVMDGTLKNDTAIKLLMALPFTVRDPSEQLLKDFEVILTLPEDSVLHSSAVLTFATLVNKVHKTGSRSHIADKYVGQYFDLFNKSHSYEKQMLYLEALGNFELNRVAEYLAPIIAGTQSRYSNHIRYLASWTTFSYYVGAAPKEAHKLYWPIFSNYDEPLEMRVAALTVLLDSSPTASRMYQLAILMLEDPSVHLRHYWYTILLSFTQSKNPCNQDMVDLAKKVIMYFPEPSVRHWSTGSYIMDHADPKYGFGSQVLLNMVANPNTGMPSTVFLEFENYAMQYSYNHFNLYVRVDGVGDLLKKSLDKIMSIEKLVGLLQELKLPLKAVEPVHIELILKVQNKAVLVHHANETSFTSLFEEEMRMTDLGTPALLRITNSWMTSVRANLTTGKQVMSQLELRSFVSSQTAVTQYNPILDMWHGVQRSLNIQTIVPFNLQLPSVSKGSIKFAMQLIPGEEIGVVGHVRTAIFVRGINAAEKLKEHCPTCPSQQEEVVEIDLLGMQFRLALLECEHSLYKEDLLEQLKEITEYQNINAFPVANFVISFLHIYDYLTLVPPSGSCGVLAKLSPLVENTTQLEVEIVRVNSTQKANNMQIIVTTNSSSRWEINTEYTHNLLTQSKHLVTRISSETGDIGNLSMMFSLPEPSVEVTSLSDMEPQSAVVHVCKDDINDVAQWGHKYAPITEACFVLAKELATLHVGQCYSLVLADCSEKPQFAIFIKKLEGAINPLAFKIYSGDNYIELLPNAHNLSIIADNEEYYGHFAMITVPGLYHGKLCGMCGNHNGDASDDSPHLYSLPCST
ncbi:hypothetical protein C0J52_01781 [Blattella germanica]|nr:hypothetical protein C0J52_01781 [Blattella germanica]